MLKIAHITDTHITEEHGNIDGIDSRNNILRVLDDIKASGADVLIHTGDLSFPRGNRSVYEWFKGVLDSLGIPFLMTPGNHDDPMIMQEVFNLKDLPPRVITTGAVALKGQSLMFLDSSGERLTMKQVIWLKREIAVQEDELVLFQHHPPVSCGVRVMDEKYPYKTPDLFRKTIAETGRHLILFTGHYHIEKKVELTDPSMTVYITPPSIGSLDPEADDYRIIDLRPGWREIHMKDQKVIYTNCHYLV